MYSVLLMAALTTGGEAPAFHHGGRASCYGCYGACYGSCYAGCYGGCAGLNYGGWGASYGCYGSCAGCAWWGHYSSCYCYGIGCVGNYPGFKSCHGDYAYYKSYNFAGDHNGCHGCYGCYGCYAGCYGGAYGCAEPTVVPAPVEPPPTTGGGNTTGMTSDGRARLVVSLPEGAKLFVDGREIEDVSSEKTFRTPVLAAGATYYYEVRAEVMQDGKPATETRRVLVRSGEVSRADFSNLGKTATTTARK